ncbi:hypothetical protein J3A83DRAFT_4083811, partial [Scleroderma citrinum]
DMKRTTLPLWVACVPHNLGSPGHGKLKSDQWHMACLINLVITLCRLWGSNDAGERDMALLHNYLSLMTACLHIFGPTHGCWAFPFKRYNGILQCFTTNTRIGEMEHTLLKAFCQGSNLRAFLSKNDASDSLQGLQEIFLQFFSVPIPSVDVTHKNDVPNATENTDRLPMLSNETYECLLNCLNEGVVPGHHYMSYCEVPQPSTWVIQPYVLEKDSIKIQGVNFTCSAKHIGNNHILFCFAAESFQHAGEIQCIFVHQRPGLQGNCVTEFFYLPDELTIHDSYQQFPLLWMQLCCNEFIEEEQVIQSHNIISHFAGCPYESKELLGHLLVDCY